MLGDLERDLGGLTVDRDRRLQRVVDVGDRIVRELDVDDRAGDACDAPDDRRLGLFGGGGGSFVVCLFRCGLDAVAAYLPDASASAPPTISAICWVISA
ncbi:hypothetical protein [Pseudoxanthomonas mexicana]